MLGLRSSGDGRRVVVIACGFRPFHAIDKIMPVQDARGSSTMVSKSTGPRRRAIYGISRVDDEKKRTHCWIVHIERKRRVWHRSFSDGVYGGKTQCPPRCPGIPG